MPFFSVSFSVSIVRARATAKMLAERKNEWKQKKKKRERQHIKIVASRGGEENNEGKIAIGGEIGEYAQGHLLSMFFYSSPLASLIELSREKDHFRPWSERKNPHTYAHPSFSLRIIFFFFFFICERRFAKPKLLSTAEEVTDKREKEKKRTQREQTREKSREGVQGREKTVHWSKI